MKIQKIVNKVVDEVISKIDNNWSNLQKIRFVYLELGKYLEKNTDFFLNEKLDSLKLEKKEILDIYLNDKINISKRKEVIQYQVVCKSAALFLKTAYDKLNIESFYVHTLGDENSVLHWFLVAKDDDKQYFLTLAADLPYIKNNIPTIHFANNISFKNEMGCISYVIPEDENIILNKLKKVDQNGKVIEYHEIAHTVLTIEQLKEIDESIGYGKLYSLSNKELNKLPRLYMMFLESDHEIFQILKKSFNIDESLSKRISTIKEHEVNTFKYELFKYIKNELNNKLNINDKTISDFESTFKIYVYKILETLNVEDIDKTLSIKELSRRYKKVISENKEFNTIIELIKNVGEVTERFDTYINNMKVYETFINELDIKNSTIEEKERILKEYSKIVENINESKKDLSITRLNYLLYNITSYFLKDEIIIDKSSKYVPLSYIVNKFCYMFPIMMECNFNSDDIKSTNFSTQGYSEQIVIIKDLLKVLFSELTENNCNQMEDYNKGYSPVENRIQTYPLKNKKTREYCIGFNFKGNSEENEVQYIYIPSENLLRESDPLQDLFTYQIGSRRFNEKFFGTVKDVEKPKIYTKNCKEE